MEVLGSRVYDSGVGVAGLGVRGLGLSGNVAHSGSDLCSSCLVIDRLYRVFIESLSSLYLSLGQGLGLLVLSQGVRVAGLKFRLQGLGLRV